MVRAGGAGMPQVDAAAFPQAGLYWDAQLLFPERFAVELLVDARDIAAAAGTRFEVCTQRHAELGRDGVLRVGPSPAGGGPFEVRPDAIVNATGAWVDRTLAAVFPGGAEAAGRRLIGGTKGSHLVVRCPSLRAALADYGIYAEAADGRPVFVLPFGPELVLVGTTDIPYVGDPAEARTDEAEIGYLLAAVTRLFPTVAVGRDQVQQHLSKMENAVDQLISQPDAALVVIRDCIPEMEETNWKIFAGLLAKKSEQHPVARGILGLAHYTRVAVSEVSQLVGHSLDEAVSLVHDIWSQKDQAEQAGFILALHAKAKTNVRAKALLGRLTA